MAWTPKARRAAAQARRGKVKYKKRSKSSSIRKSVRKKRRRRRKRQQPIWGESKSERRASHWW